MYRVTMKKNTLGDTRTAERMPIRAEFDVANVLHISDVNALVASFVQEMIKRVNRHDWTKVNEPYATMFYDDMKANIESGKAPFEEMEWYKHHVNNERHHLKDCVPDDVDLIDVIEMLADCVSAGMTRSGHVYEIKIPDSVLQKAVSNTVKKMIDAVEIEDGEAMTMAIEALADRPTGWIPVSERLPIPPTFCLVTTDGSRGDVIDIALYMSDGWHKASEVLAWMPLPEPYKEDEHE